MPALTRLIFFGTPEFALPTLHALVAAGREPLLVVTRPPRRAGRGQRLQQPAVATWALAHGLAVRQPERVREESFLAGLRELAPELAVVVAFGQIFPPSLLVLPRQGCVNVHASLLPRHRGAAPVQAALRGGDAETGVSTMQMDEGLDTGPVFLRAATRLSGEETAGELAPRLAHLGASLLLETIAGLEAGTLEARPQPAAGASHAPRLSREDGRADWRRPAPELFDQWRAVTPWPGLHTVLRQEPLRVLRCRLLQERGEAPAGTLLGIRGDDLAVACGGGGVLGLERLQRPGRRGVSARELVSGERLREGERLGLPPQAAAEGG